MNTLLRSSNEKEIDRIIEFIPSILEVAETDITSFYKSQARINNLYRRAKGLLTVGYMDKYTIESIDEEFSKTREELDDIYYKITS